MALTYLNRTVRFVWEHRPFESLEVDSINVQAGIRSPGGDPIIQTASTWMMTDQPPDIPIGFGRIGIPESKSGRIWLGAGPWVVKGKDGRDYSVWMSKRGRILDWQQEAVLLVEWHVEATV